MSGYRRTPDHGETASIAVADYLFERDVLRPKESDVVDEINERYLRASDLRAVVDALVTARRDLKVARHVRFRTRIDIEHKLMPTDAPPADYREATCNCSASARVINQDAAEIWHAVHVRWPAESAAELATRMKASLRDSNVLRT